VDGVWVLIGADLAVFGVLFASFMHDRVKSSHAFEESSRTLNFNFGGVDTLILLTSSWLVALAVDAAKRGPLSQVARRLAAGLVCGVAFVVSKSIEYADKLGSGISPKTDDFSMWYFTLTGLHLVHVIVGSALLAVVWSKARNATFTSQHRVVLECIASLPVPATHHKAAYWLFWPLLHCPPGLPRSCLVLRRVAGSRGAAALA
jgi:nitric oxide reductase NorE protein